MESGPGGVKQVKKFTKHPTLQRGYEASVRPNLGSGRVPKAKAVGLLSNCASGTNGH
jgi:hypothetical protein